MAERKKAIELIGAAQAAEREALRLTSAARAEKAASADRGAAIRAAGRGRRRRRQDQARWRCACAPRSRPRRCALMNEAHNMLTPEARASALRLKLVEKAEAIIRESVKPMERIEGIKILQVDGLGGGGGAANGDGQRRRLRRQRRQLGAALPRPGADRRPAAARDRARRRRHQPAGRRRRRRQARCRSAAAGVARRVEPRRRSTDGAMVRVYVSSVIDATRRHRLGARARLQRAAAVAPGHRRQPHREQRAERQDRLHPPLPHRATAA